VSPAASASAADDSTDAIIAGGGGENTRPAASARAPARPHTEQPSSSCPARLAQSRLGYSTNCDVITSDVSRSRADDVTDFVK